MLRKMLLVCALLALVLAAVDVGLGVAADCKNPAALKIGRMGFRSENPEFACQVRVRALKPDVAPAAKGKLAAHSVLSLRTSLDRGARDVFDQPVYVYFDLNARDASAWANDRLEVVFYDAGSQRWEVMPSARLSGGSTGRLRVGSTVTQFGLCGLAKLKGK